MSRCCRLWCLQDSDAARAYALSKRKDIFEAIRASMGTQAFITHTKPPRSVSTLSDKRGAESSPVCWENLQTLQRMWADLGIQARAKKHLRYSKCKSVSWYSNKLSYCSKLHCAGMRRTIGQPLIRNGHTSICFASQVDYHCLNAMMADLILPD